MKITKHDIPVREIVAKFTDDGESGVSAYDGRLNVRPAYQREFIYKEEQERAVIDSILKDYPLNVMYWSKISPDEYEIIDGQQRTLSICHFIAGNFSVLVNGHPRAYGNLSNMPDIQQKIMEYPLSVYICDGTEAEKQEWFKIINIAGEKLTEQELRNAVYTGPWLSDAKKHFSKTNCGAYALAKDYLRGSPIRQDYLETALRWMCDREDMDNIEEYMAAHQNDKDAAELWVYFQEVINWVTRTFTVLRKKEMQGIEWGILYNNYARNKYNPADLERRLEELMADDDVTKKAGAYEYVLGGDERCLSIRAFTPSERRAAYERQGGTCPICCSNGILTHYELEEMEADHIMPWSKGGKTKVENCQMLCKACNRKKSGK